MKDVVAHQLVNLLSLRFKRVFFVYGMRRSGNHAFVRWLVNALEERPVDFTPAAAVRRGWLEVKHPRLKFSTSGKTAFFNDVSVRSGKNFSLKCH